MEKISMKMFPDVLALAKCIDSKHNFYAIYEDLSSDNKYSIVVGDIENISMEMMKVLLIEFHG